MTDRQKFNNALDRFKANNIIIGFQSMEYKSLWIEFQRDLGFLIRRHKSIAKKLSK